MISCPCCHIKVFCGAVQCYGFSHQRNMGTTVVWSVRILFVWDPKSLPKEKSQRVAFWLVLLPSGTRSAYKSPFHKSVFFIHKAPCTNGTLMPFTETSVQGLSSWGWECMLGCYPKFHWACPSHWAHLENLWDPSQWMETSLKGQVQSRLKQVCSRVHATVFNTA